MRSGQESGSASHRDLKCKVVCSPAAAAARFLPRDVERLDDDDRELLRAAYDSPSYDHDNYEEDDDMKLGKLDLVKDGLWVIKAKIKELKAFDKALVANLLSTKLRLKDLMENHLDVIKKHHHEKPTHHAYQVRAHPATLRRLKHFLPSRLQ